MKEDIPWCQIACEISELAANLNARGDGHDFASESSLFVKYDPDIFKESKKWWHVYKPLYTKLLGTSSGVKIATLGQFNHPSEEQLNRTWVSLCSSSLTADQFDRARDFASCLKETVQLPSGGDVKLSRSVHLTTDSLEVQSRSARSNGEELLRPLGTSFVSLSYKGDYKIEIQENVPVAGNKADLLELMKKVPATQSASYARGSLWLRAMTSAVGATTILAIPGWLPPDPNGVHTGVLVLYLDNTFEWSHLPGIISAYRAGCLMYLGVSEQEKIENLWKSREQLHKIMPDLIGLLSHSKEIGDHAWAIARKLDPSARKFLRHKKDEISLLYRSQTGYAYYPVVESKSFGLKANIDEKERDNYTKLEIAHSRHECKWTSQSTEGSYSDFFEKAGDEKNWNEPWMKTLAKVSGNYSQDAFNFAKIILHRPLFEDRYLYEVQLFFASWYATCWTTDERPPVSLSHSTAMSFSHNKGNSAQLSFEELFQKFGFASQIHRRDNSLLAEESNDALLHPGALTSLEFLSAFVEFIEELAPNKGNVKIRSIDVLFAEPGAVVDIQCSDKFPRNGLTITQTSTGRGFRGALRDLCEGFGQTQLFQGSRYHLNQDTAIANMLGKLPGFYWMDSGEGTRFLLSFTRRPPDSSGGAG